VILVTGGTGVLGRVVVDRLRAAGQQVRVLSRKPGPDRVVADLSTGEGLAAAVADAEVIVHLASIFRRGRDPKAAQRLLAAAGGVGHLVYVSIVGVDRVPFGYYQDKLAVERLIERSGVPYTVQRATQFHDLIRTQLAGAAKLPVLPLPAWPFQPVDVRDVADRVAELAAGKPAGRAPDFGGPEVHELRDLAREYLTVTGRRRAILPVRLPGKVFRAYRAGGHLTPEHATGKVTFAEYLAEHPNPRRVSYR
jgi:uncharacterized protein YbjT (DUF2867 family)